MLLFNDIRPYMNEEDQRILSDLPGVGDSVAFMICVRMLYAVGLKIPENYNKPFEFYQSLFKEKPLFFTDMERYCFDAPEYIRVAGEFYAKEYSESPHTASYLSDKVGAAMAC